MEVKFPPGMFFGRSNRIRALIVLCGFTIFGQVASAGQLAPCDGGPGNLLQNCGFESGDFTGWTQSGNTDSTFVFNSFDGFSPNSGSYLATLGPAGADGYLSQAITTTPGDVYTISWYLASDAQTPNDFNVTWDGNSIFSQTDLVVPDWVLYSFTATASTSSTSLTFGFSDDLGYLALDDTSVQDTTLANTAAPEPNTGSLLFPVIALGLFWRRKANASHS